MGALKQPQPVFIIGAGRSGTNVLGHLLGRHELVQNTFENRYIWNFRQSDLNTDIRDKSEASDETKRFIRRRLLEGRDGAHYVVDKTPGNAVRLGFVREVFPDSKIVNVFRNGFDNLTSRKKMWSQSRGNSLQRAIGHFEQFKAMQKRGNIPVRQLHVFAWDNFARSFKEAVKGERHLAGERFSDLGQICADKGESFARVIQWRRCVRASITEGRRLPPNQYLELKFEDLLSDPHLVLNQLLNFLELEEDHRCCSYIKNELRSTNSSAAAERPQLSGELMEIIEKTNRLIGY